KQRGFREPIAPRLGLERAKAIADESQAAKSVIVDTVVWIAAHQSQTRSVAAAVGPRQQKVAGTCLRVANHDVALAAVFPLAWGERRHRNGAALSRDAVQPIHGAALSSEVAKLVRE